MFSVDVAPPLSGGGAGGGFGGGVILALALLNVLLAYGRDFTQKWLNIHLLEHIESLSALLFVIVGILGVLVGGLMVAMYLPIFMLGSVV